MFQLSFNECTGLEADKIRGQFENFVNTEDLLAPCEIVFHERNVFDENSRLLCKIAGFVFYANETSYFVLYKTIFGNDCVVKINQSFTRMDVQYYDCGLNIGRSIIANPLYIGYRYCALSAGNMMVHGAAVVCDEQAIVFCGKSGAGKSTQANLWKKYLNAWVLNYDKPCIIPLKSKAVINGSPWSGKEGVYINKSADLIGIVFVEQCAEDRLRRLSIAEAFAYMMVNNYLYPLNDDIEQMYIKIIQRIVELVPVYVLHCTVSQNAVKTLYEEVYHKEYTFRE